MVIKNLQIFIRWAEKHEINFEYSPYDAIDFNELEASEFAKEIKNKIEIQLQERKKIKDKEKRAYLDAFRGNTINTYRRYLKEFPNGKYAEEARIQIEEKKKKAIKKDDGLSFKNILKLVSKKCDLDETREDKNLMRPEFLLNAIREEVEELKEELYAHNHAHLEDELGDILWGWMALVEKLNRKGYTGSHEDIFRRTLKKYYERIEPLDGTDNDYDRWKEVKAKQKKVLADEKKVNNEKRKRVD